MVTHLHVVFPGIREGIFFESAINSRILCTDILKSFTNDCFIPKIVLYLSTPQYSYTSTNCVISRYLGHVVSINQSPDINARDNGLQDRNHVAFFYSTRATAGNK